MDLPSIYSPFSAPVFALQLTNDGEPDLWQESALPRAEGGPTQITTEFLNRVPVEVLILILFSPFGEES